MPIRKYKAIVIPVNGKNIALPLGFLGAVATLADLKEWEGELREQIDHLHPLVEVADQFGNIGERIEKLEKLTPNFVMMQWEFDELDPADIPNGATIDIY